MTAAVLGAPGGVVGVRSAATPASARAVLAQVVGHRSPISLDTVLAAAELQTRVDTKYLLTPAQLRRLDTGLPGGFRALQIGEQRLFGYDSVYFDTPDLTTFGDHRQGRRRRYKVRTRTYTDSGDSLFEVKVEGHRGATVKERLPRSPEVAGRVDAEARSFLDGVLLEHGIQPPRRLVPVLRTGYRRATLVDPEEGSRLTLDVELSFDGPRARVAGPDRVVVESKSLAGGAADRVLAAQGVRPVSLSKYCAGIALTRPGVRANRWNRILRREFGWTPTA